MGKEKDIRAVLTRGRSIQKKLSTTTSDFNFWSNLHNVGHKRAVLSMVRCDRKCNHMSSMQYSCVNHSGKVSLGPDEVVSIFASVHE